MPNDFAAGDAALGYLYQSRYALLLMLKARPDSEMSIERFDDVAFEEAGEPIELIQTKHHLRTSGSLSDASRDLWTTLRAWSEQMAHGSLPPGELFLTVVTTGIAGTDSAASKLRPLESGPRDVEGALAILEQVATESENEANRSAYEALLNLGEEKRRELLSRIRVLDGSPSITDVREQIIERLTLLTRPQFLGPLVERIEGWWFDKVVRHLLGGSAEPITYAELHSQISDIQEQFHQDNLPIDFFDAIAPDEEELPQDQRVFVEQLRIVAVQHPRIKMAISDFYRAFEQRSRWIRDDLLFVGELDKYEKRLVEEWSRLFEVMKEDLGKTPSEEVMTNEGRRLFNVVDQRHIPVRPRVVEPYVMRGSYHILANRLKVGWHPKFIEKLQQLLAPLPGARS